MNETILFVDDDAPVRRVMGRGLRLKGYTAIEAESAEKALELFGAVGAGIRLLITDITMPGMDGITLARRLTDAKPELCVILVSGCSDRLAVEDISSTRVRLLTKPFSLEVLVTTATELLAVS